MTAPPIHDTFRALGDPTRRQIVDWLANGDAVTATELAERVPMTRQAVSRHMRALVAGGLAIGSRHGREVRYSLNPDALEDAARWLERRSASWDRALTRLASHLDRDEA